MMYIDRFKGLGHIIWLSLCRGCVLTGRSKFSAFHGVRFEGWFRVCCLGYVGEKLACIMICMVGSWMAV